jgi:serine phosphatase RsbU (regulator of sigma subunit)/anti-sigma regulatory factor (Ser/Thr protein kinase)
MTIRDRVRQLIRGEDNDDDQAVRQVPARPEVQADMLDLDIHSSDPLLLLLQNASGVVDVERLQIDSPALATLKADGVKLIVPLVSQGELVGLVNLGSRLSEQDYSSDDRKLLGDLATQAAPAVRVAQLARQQQAEARERERLAQELRVARLIQQTLLPRSVPALEGYEVAAYYQPAREVGGDFYDFLYFEDGRVGLIIGDVTDKGVPAALVMATTRTLLRAAAERLEAPGAVLERVNELLYPDIPARMFVTCLYALLNPANGRLRYANAGHDVPYRRGSDGVDELRARGMPLGLMQGMTYEEKEIELSPGETVLFHSDGLVEAHDPKGEMFGFPQLQHCMAKHGGGAALIPYLLDHLGIFTGEGWEQEDDVTLVTLQRLPESSDGPSDPVAELRSTGQLVAAFSIASEPGNERLAMERVGAVAGSILPGERALQKLKTAVAEATMNAMEHGNQYRADAPVEIEVYRAENSLIVKVIDQGGGEPVADPETPDLGAKLAGEQSPRGWGLFLIRNMVDEMHVTTDQEHHTVELIIHLDRGEADEHTEAI